MDRLRLWLTGNDRRADFARAVAVYLATRVLLALFIWLTGQHYDCHGPRCTDRGFFPHNFLLNGLFQWDAFQYAQLARRGYYWGQGFDTTVPYFPGFPILANTIGKLFGSALVGGIVVNHIASIVAAFLMTRLCRRLVIKDTVAANGNAEETARDVSIFWLASPLTFFFCVYLSESVFAFASVLMIWGVVCGRWPAALLGGVLATATRNAGVIVCCGAIVLAWERRREVPLTTMAWICLALSPLGLAIIVIWQKVALGDGFAWVLAQRRWNRFLVFPWRTFSDDWQGVPGLNGRNVDQMYRTQEVLAMLLTAPLLFLRKRLSIPWGLWLIGVGEWLLPIASHSFISIARYQSGNLYFALAIPAFLQPRPTLRTLTWMAFGMVLAWYASTYPFGDWAS